MIHLDIFSGIGGFALAARWMGWETTGFCEIDPYCRAVIGKHWPGKPIFNDIRTLTRQSIRDAGIKRVDILTGGFPCQDISPAGRGAGITGERSGLWKELRRVIAEVLPAWVVIENSPVLRTRGADVVLGQMESLGYTCWPLVVGADDVGAPHIRKRVWIVAYRDGERSGQGAERTGWAQGANIDRCCERAAVADADRQRCGERQIEPITDEPALAATLGCCEVGNACCVTECEQDDEAHTIRSWEESTEKPRGTSRRLAKPLLGGVTYGIPSRLDGHEPPGRSGDEGATQFGAPFLCWPAGKGQEQHDWEPPRTVKSGLFSIDRRRGLGNAIVPQVAYEIFRAIEQVR